MTAMATSRATSAGTLGRNFTANTATLGLVAPQAVWGDRLNEFDLRFTKIVNTGGRSRLDLNVDLFNAFNSDAVLSEQAAYSGTNGGAWLLPTSVLQGRIVKFGVRLDF